MQYDEDHLPRSNGIPCVSKLHCQDFFRQLRKSIKKRFYPVTCKYFLVSEYGPQTHRPHYHCLLLFTYTENIERQNMLELRQALYELVKARWYHGHCQETLFHSGVVRYLTKYVFKSSDDYEPPVPCFRLISKGIGEKYLSVISRSQVIRDKWRTPDGLLPRYYRDKLFPVTPHEIDSPNRITRSIINDRRLDDMHKNVFNGVKRSGSIEQYIKEQEYLLRSQKRAVERKEKQKYG